MKPEQKQYMIVVLDAIKADINKNKMTTSLKLAKARIDGLTNIIIEDEWQGIV